MAIGVLDQTIKVGPRGRLYRSVDSRNIDIVGVDACHMGRSAEAEEKANCSVRKVCLKARHMPNIIL
jgi:hypothetical protein